LLIAFLGLSVSGLSLAGDPRPLKGPKLCIWELDFCLDGLQYFLGTRVKTTEKKGDKKKTKIEADQETDCLFFLILLLFAYC
jgi:hypothetical protein